MNYEALTDVNAESTVIASLLWNPSLLFEADMLEPKHFSRAELQVLFYAISTLVNDGITDFDIVNVSNIINQNPTYKKIMDDRNLGNLESFKELSKEVARNTVPEFQAVVNSVLSMAYKREALKTLRTLEQSCFNEDKSYLEINRELEDASSDLGNRYLASADLRLVGDVADELWEEVISKRTPTGYGIDPMITSLKPYFTHMDEELTILAATKKTGKSSFGQALSVYFALRKHPVLYLDTEMGDRAYMLRILSHISGVPQTIIRDGTYTKEEEERVMKARALYKKLPIIHEYIPTWTEESVYAMVRRAKIKHNVEVLIFDYLKCEEGDNYGYVSLKLGRLTSLLKNKIAGAMHMKVFSMAQIGRTGKISSSERIEWFASTILTLKKKTPQEIMDDGGIEKGGNYSIHVDLNRNGDCMDETEHINLMFDGARTRFQDLGMNVPLSPFDEHPEEVEEEKEKDET